MRLTISPYPNDLEWKGRLWELREDYEFAGYKIPRGFVTDGITIGRLLWRVLGHPLGKPLPAAVVHDFLLKQGIPRETCDKAFLRCLEKLKIPLWKRKIMYWGVRINSILKGG